MKRMIFIFSLIFALVLSWSIVSAEDGFYVIATKKKNFAPVPKTGQSASSATGDDGDMEKGVAWPDPRFTDNGDGTVKDNLTELIWLKNANCTDEARIWTTALSDVAQLNTDGTMKGINCGDTSNGGSHQTDWRLPNVRELQSLIHYGYNNPALPNTAGTGQWSEDDPFSGVQSSYYWSATTHADDALKNNAWYVHMSDGLVTYRWKINDNYVWPVRGGN